MRLTILTSLQLFKKKKNNPKKNPTQTQNQGEYKNSDEDLTFLKHQVRPSHNFFTTPVLLRINALYSQKSAPALMYSILFYFPQLFFTYFII